MITPSIIITSFIALCGVLWGFYEKTQVEHLKQRLELEKNQKLLNDEKIRGVYESFVEIAFDAMKNKNGAKEKLEEEMINFMKTTLLFAGPKTIKSFGMYRKESAANNKKEIFLYLEDLLKSMRSDLGVSNEGINRYDILQTFMIGNAKDEIAKLNKIN